VSTRHSRQSFISQLFKGIESAALVSIFLYLHMKKITSTTEYKEWVYAKQKKREETSYDNWHACENNLTRQPIIKDNSKPILTEDIIISENLPTSFMIICTEYYLSSCFNGSFIVFKLFHCKLWKLSFNGWTLKIQKPKSSNVLRKHKNLLFFSCVYWTLKIFAKYSSSRVKKPWIWRWSREHTNIQSDPSKYCTICHQSMWGQSQNLCANR